MKENLFCDGYGSLVSLNLIGNFINGFFFLNQEILLMKVPGNFVLYDKKLSKIHFFHG